MLVRDKDITSEGNLGGLVVNMSLDEKGLSKIMSLLTNLYSDPAMATIRETCTNALDSHIAAKQNRPILISTPNRMYPYFVVQDFGVGMSTDDVVNIVSKYGASTKTKSDDYNGMMGIGLKSPLAYTDQFTIIGVKDGKKSSILVSRTTDGASSMEIVDVSDTDEPNGVMVKVPVNKDFNDFVDKVNEFCDYADASKFLLNDKVYDNRFKQLKDNIFIKENNDYYSSSRDKIVMGNVAYPIASSNLMPNHSVVFYVPMGSVAFTPSREAMEYTTQTKKTIDDLREEFNVVYAEWLSKETEKQKTYREAVIKSLELRQTHHVVKDLMWHGEVLPDRNLTYKYGYWSGNLNDASGYCTYGVSGWSDNVGKADNDNKVLVYIKNFDNIRFTRVQAKKVSKYLADNKLDVVRKVYLFPSNFDPRLFEDGLTVYDWEEIKKVQLSTVARPKGTTWEGRQPGVRGISIYTPDKKKPVYYGNKKELQRSSADDHIAEYGDQFVFVSDTKREKFLEKYPHAKHFREWFGVVVQSYIDTLTQADYDYFQMDVNCNQLTMIKSDDILDPELKLIAEHNNGDSDRSRERDKYQRYWSYIPYNEKRNYKFPESSSISKGRKVLDRYPMLQGSYYGSRSSLYQKHLLDYVNSVYLNEVKRKGV